MIQRFRLCSVELRVSVSTSGGGWYDFRKLAIKAPSKMGLGCTKLLKLPLHWWHSMLCTGMNVKMFTACSIVRRDWFSLKLPKIPYLQGTGHSRRLVQAWKCHTSIQRDTIQVSPVHLYLLSPLMLESSFDDIISYVISDWVVIYFPYMPEFA